MYPVAMSRVPFSAEGEEESQRWGRVVVDRWVSSRFGEPLTSQEGQDGWGCSRTQKRTGPGTLGSRIARRPNQHDKGVSWQMEIVGGPVGWRVDLTATLDGAEPVGRRGELVYARAARGSCLLEGGIN